MTVQAPDKIIINGETHQLGAHHILHSGEGGLDCTIVTEIPLQTENPLITANEKYSDGSTACWRGYIATWEIKKEGDEEYLYLIAINGSYKKNRGSFKLSKEVKATWVSGLIKCVVGGWYGTQSKYSLFINRHAHFADQVYPKEIHCKVYKGEVTQKMLIDNSGIVIWNEILSKDDKEIIKYLGIHPLLDEAIERRLKE